MSVAREGLETVLFLSVVFSAAPPRARARRRGRSRAGRRRGHWHRDLAFGVRVDLRRFFRAYGRDPDLRRSRPVCSTRFTSSARRRHANSGTVFDISDVLPESSPLGAVLAGLFGYRSAPTPLEVVAYFAYLIPVDDLPGHGPATSGATSRHGIALRSPRPPPVDNTRSLHRTHLPNCTLVRQIRARSALPVGRLGSVGLAAPFPSRDRPDTDETVVGGGSHA